MELNQDPPTTWESMWKCFFPQESPDDIDQAPLDFL